MVRRNERALEGTGRNLSILIMGGVVRLVRAPARHTAGRGSSPVAPARMQLSKVLDCPAQGIVFKMTEFYCDRTVSYTIQAWRDMFNLKE